MTPPRATYRLQLRREQPFAAVVDAIPYLARLGISHLYLSPVLQPADGSTHGYDVVDPDRVNDALGGEPGWQAVVDVARAAGLGILLDIVPNHMSIAGTGNRWWLDVLENGPASYHAHFFDVDWTFSGDDRVLLPVLGERYGRALLGGHLRVEGEPGGRFAIRAGDLRLPMSPRSLGELVGRAGARSRDPELSFLGDALTALPFPHGHGDPRSDADRKKRHRDQAVLRARLAEVLATRPACARAIADELAATNREPAELDAILEHQNYRLVHWTVAQAQLGYRRFFDITTLVGVRTEDPEVFEASHARILGWLRDHAIDGVRIDHVDGLRAPLAYLERLREDAPGAWIVVEKILAPGERLPPAWPVGGTTGYEFVEAMGALLVDPDGERPLTACFEAYTGHAFDPATESRRARLEVMHDALHSELARLTELAARACAASVECRDFTRAEIEVALAEIIAGYPAYRTYLGAGSAATGRDRIVAAVASARAARPELDADLLGFLDRALGFEVASPQAAELARVAQQVTGAIVAKGDEDTVLYRQVRLLSRCEVGCDLATFAAPPEEIHRRLAAGPPRSLLASSTHDTKRGEDVRARIAVLSELADDWRDAVWRWRERAERGWGDVEPDRVLEYAVWQTLIGAWPLPLERLRRWAEKATREARLRTSWRQPDAGYERARDAWLAGIYADRGLVDDVARFAARVAPHGARNSLAQTLIKMTAPGVADIYQGCELLDDSLVDPDNRRPVDLAARAAALAALAALEGGWHGDPATAKLWLIHRALAHRPPEQAGYAPLVAAGAHAHRVFAFARGSTITVVPRLGVRADGWRDTTLALPPGRWRDVLGGRGHAGTVAIAELWQGFPVALLVSADR